MSRLNCRCVKNEYLHTSIDFLNCYHAYALLICRIQTYRDLFMPYSSFYRHEPWRSARRLTHSYVY